MEAVDLGELTDAQRAELEGEEDDPFGDARLTLRYRGKERHVVLRDGGRLVASAGLTTAEVGIASERFAVVGLGGVIVSAQRRGEGLARQVVEAAMVRARAIGPAFAILFCHADRAGLYEKLEFRTVTSAVRIEQPQGLQPTVQQVMWRALRPGATWPPGDVTVYGLPF